MSSLRLSLISGYLSSLNTTFSASHPQLKTLEKDNDRIREEAKDEKKSRNQEKMTKTYNTGDSPVATDLGTNPALSSLTMGERTGSRIFWKAWSYVLSPGAEVSLVLTVAVCWEEKRGRRLVVHRPEQSL